MSGTGKVRTERTSKQIFLGVKPPDDDNCKIWRYMDLSKFVWMIQNKALFFANFKNFDDPFEGRFPYEDVIEICKSIRKENKDISEEKALENAKVYVKNTNGAIHEYADYFINCWHRNEFESEAMWKIYSELDMGIAIQSTYKILDGCLLKYYESEEVFVGEVNYNKTTDWVHGIGNPTIYTPFYHKRISFEHEREIRAIMVRPKDNDQSKTMNNNHSNILEYKRNSELIGLQVPISLEELIKNVYISPKASSYFTMLVKTILKEYDCKDINVIHSSLYDINLY